MMRDDSTLHDAECGFTLLELVVVMAVLALAVTMALPRAERAPAGQSLRLAVTEITAALKIARAQAMRSNTEARVVVDGRTGRVMADGQARPLPLPRGIGVSWDTPAGEHVGEGSTQVRFRPDGSSTGATFRISARQRMAVIRVDWLTGRTQVAWSQ